MSASGTGRKTQAAEMRAVESAGGFHPPNFLNQRGQAAAPATSGSRGATN